MLLPRREQQPAGYVLTAHIKLPIQHETTKPEKVLLYFPSNFGRNIYIAFILLRFLSLEQKPRYTVLQLNNKNVHILLNISGETLFKIRV